MRYLIKFSYDGSNYCGYQRQKGLNTIQEQLENALFKINNSKYTTLTATGRTDKHVHALSQYAHTDIDVTITPYKLKRALNSNLPNDIHVIKVYSVKDIGITVLKDWDGLCINKYGKTIRINSKEIAQEYCDLFIHLFH